MPVCVAAVAIEQIRRNRLVGIWVGSRIVIRVVEVQATDNIDINNLMLVNARQDGLAGEQHQDKNGDGSTEFDHGIDCCAYCKWGDSMRNLTQH